MGAAVDVCTWEPRGQASKFVVGADVAGACFGHMVASVWGGSAVRQCNKYCLERCLALSVAERGNGAGAPPQHAWAAALLDACKLQQIRSRRSCSSSESSNSDSDSAGGGVLTGCENEDEETFRDWGTPYEDVERLLGAPASCLDTSMSTTNACTLVSRLYKYVRRGFKLCPLSVVKSLCYYEPPPTSTCVCTIVDCPFATEQTIDTIIQSLATFARNHPNMSSFAVARHERNARNTSRLRQAIKAASC